MFTVPQEFVTVDMRGLKAALVARARAHKVSVSAVVRAAVAASIGIDGPSRVAESEEPLSRTVKLSLRFSQAQVRRLDAAARAAGLSRAAYLCGLDDDVPVLAGDADFQAHRAALTTSNAELAGVGRRVHHLTSLMLDFGPAANEWRAALDRLEGDVRSHLGMAGTVLADLRPRARLSGPNDEVEHGSRR